jgi:hypothetical protein
VRLALSIGTCAAEKPTNTRGFAASLSHDNPGEIGSARRGEDDSPADQSYLLSSPIPDRNREL